MPFNSPDIETFKINLDVTISAVQKLHTNSHATIKIQSLLNLTVYVLATRFLEGSVKHIVYNLCKIRGDDSQKLQSIQIRLKGFNNPEFNSIRDLVKELLAFDISLGQEKGIYTPSDITFLNQIVQNRHKNVHASFDSAEWYNQNRKDISDFGNEYAGLLKVLEYLDSIRFDSSCGKFLD